ncbi:acyl carrier protein [Lentzea sp. CA-135723]|uniref:acyl carrier protein n=1 Tax=Lentzea sp. CA-135723 TaxID=3239950 RepID=UPI003D8ED033
MTTSISDVRSRIREHVCALVGMADVPDDCGLISEHVLDSVAAIGMVDFVERTFGIEIEDEDLSMTNLDTIDGLVALVERKLGTP